MLNVTAKLDIIQSMIKREEYLEKLRQLKDANLIKVVTGIRRCGKSTLLKQFQDELRNMGVVDRNIITLNFEQAENEILLDWRKLHSFILKLTDPEKKNYVFLDEIQNVKEFEKAIDSLFTRENLDIYITGSNAYMLSSELATFLSGRYIEIKMLPLSFAEYLSAYEDRTDLSTKLEEYIRFGSFPEVSNLIHSGAKAQVTNYLASIYATVLEKDILQRNDIRAQGSFNNVVKFLYDSIGSIVSPNRIANVLTNDGKRVDRAAVENYLKALTSSFVLYKVDRFDIKGKNVLKTLDKYYSVDTGLLSVIIGKDSGTDMGHLLENIVYLELLRRGNDVWVGKVGDMEVDFVTRDKDGFTSYYQVAYSMLGKETREREIRALDGISDHNQKFVITMDAGEYSYSGIRQMNVVDWLTR